MKWFDVSVYDNVIGFSIREISEEELVEIMDSVWNNSYYFTTDPRNHTKRVKFFFRENGNEYFYVCASSMRRAKQLFNQYLRNNRQYKWRTDEMVLREFREMAGLL